jgi:hybrid cluster-associated redox disulfide protein
MPRYHADMLIQDVLTSHPGASAVFERHGLACGACLGADIETLKAVAQMHGVSVQELIAELDELPEQREREEQ